MTAPFTATELLACAERELRRRARRYPVCLNTGRMTRAEAEREYRMMRAIVVMLMEREDAERLPLGIQPPVD